MDVLSNIAPFDKAGLIWVDEKWKYLFYSGCNGLWGNFVINIKKRDGPPVR